MSSVSSTITRKVSTWKEELVLLAKIATTQPHASFAALIHGFIHRFTYLARTNPNICSLLQPLENTIRSQLIPTWTGKAPPSDLECDLFALHARLEGLGIVNPITLFSKEFPAAVSISAPLCDLLSPNKQVILGGSLLPN